MAFYIDLMRGHEIDKFVVRDAFAAWIFHMAKHLRDGRGCQGIFLKIGENTKYYNNHIF